jgi:hypothetical protein
MLMKEPFPKWEGLLFKTTEALLLLIFAPPVVKQ